MAVWIGYLKSAQSIVQIQGHRQFDSRQMHGGLAIKAKSRTAQILLDQHRWNRIASPN
jgi:hypothetical protein